MTGEEVINMEADIAQSTASELTVTVAVGAYMRWRKAQDLADSLQEQCHREVAQLTEQELGQYAEQTTAWDTQRARRRG